MSGITAKTPAKAPAKPTAAAGKAGANSAQPDAAPSVAGDNKAIEKLEATTKAVNANNIARVANSQLTANDESLHPLVSLKTGKPIEKFPKTSKDIDKVTLTMIDGMLNELQADRSGSEAIKRERFRVQIGLKANPA
ncbi:hypothetical protein LTR37_019319 [Vermiconidia calcicola]|uniref:Uncharacterized protein n=1 Tax=Vermiconidia calcicola TaxID=1690605 RepID=A0ACC3MEH9_9PEZI|nr:hypothetical protein LTR37_019319 [Vermiconidia calcicola]